MLANLIAEFETRVEDTLAGFDLEPWGEPEAPLGPAPYQGIDIMEDAPF